MSSPATKPFDPSDPSAYAPKWLRERRPKEPRLVKSDGGDPPPSVDPPKRPPEPKSHFKFLPLQREDHLRELESTLRVLQQKPVPPRSASALEKTLRDQTHEEAPRDPTRAWTPPLVPALGHRRGSSSSGGSMFIEGFRVPRSLEPQYLPPPPQEPRSTYVRRAISLLIMSGIAAPLAYFSIVGWEPASPPSQPKKSAAVQTGTVMLASVPQTPPKVQPSEGERNIAKTPDRRDPFAGAASPASVSTQPTPSPSATVPQTNTVGWAAPGAGNEGATSKKILRQLHPEEIDLLITQGEQFIAAGDLVTARTVFQRAAEAGDAKAALALGATYDPMLLARLGVKGVGGDADKARTWYERAKEFGSSEASRRLEMLASR